MMKKCWKFTEVQGEKKIKAFIIKESHHYRYQPFVKYVQVNL